VVEPLHSLTALGRSAPETVEIGPYRIVERCDVALASVATRKDRAADVAAAAKSLGLPLPDPARWVDGAPFAAFWVAPEMWFVEAPFASHEDIVAHLKPAFGSSASITEQTDAWVRFDLSGVGLPTLMEQLSNVDLAPVPDGYATRTVIEHLGCYLIKRRQGEVTLYGGRSSAGSLLHALETTARSVV
jgi:sarcosine oxidase, subunit gamma